MTKETLLNHDRSPQSPRFLTEKEVQARTGYKHTWLWKAVKSGTFPTPIKYGRSTRFVEAEIDSWIRARIADRDGTNAVPRLLFTEREVANALGISVSLLQKDRVTRQRFPFIKVGVNVRYDIDDVRAALKATSSRVSNNAGVSAEGTS